LLIASIAGKQLFVHNIDGPVGVMGRTSHNKLIEQLLGWRPDENLEYGLEHTYKWIKGQVNDLQ
jgi:nucleoside-diphosphate-sugar epimerase